MNNIEMVCKLDNDLGAEAQHRTHCKFPVPDHWRWRLFKARLVLFLVTSSSNERTTSKNGPVKTGPVTFKVQRPRYVWRLSWTK